MKELVNQYILGDAFEYLPKIENQSVDLVFIGMPDIEELGGISVDDYRVFIGRALVEIARIIKEKGFVIFCQTDRKIGGTIFLKHCVIAEIMLKLGFIIKDYKILVKDSVDKINLFRLNYSHVLIFSREGKISAEKRRGEYLKDLWVFPLPTNKNFFGEEFCELVIKTFSNEGDLVVDPFAGRGTVLKVAKKLGRKYFGTEIKSDIYDLKYVQG